MPPVAMGHTVAPWRVQSSLRLRLALAGWLGLVILTLVLFAAGIPVIVGQMRVPCVAAAGASCYRWQLSPQVAAQLAAHGLSLNVYAAYKIALEALFLLVFCATATVIVLRRAEEPIALFAAVMLVSFGGGPFIDSSRALGLTAPVWRDLDSALCCLGWSSLFLFFYLFPDGRFEPRWTRFVALGWPLFVVLGYVAPLTWPVSQGDARHDGGPLFAAGLLTFFATVVVAQIERYRRVSSASQRQQAKWVVCGFALALGGLALMMLVLGPILLNSRTPAIIANGVGLFSFYALLLPIPLSLAVAMLRYRLWEIDLLLNRTLVYGALTAAVVILYVLVVTYLGAVFHTDGNLLISLVATGLVAALFQPLRERLQRAINRLMYGERDDPYTVLARLGARLDATIAPEAVLPAICETLTEALRLPYAAIALRTEGDLTVAAAAGAPAPSLHRLPLVYQHELVGQLRLALRPGEAGFGPADLRLLDDLARQVGVAAYAVRLTTELRRSREQLVLAREEERRRIRRDLHDGLGPLLGSLTLKLDVAEDLVERDPTATRALLQALSAESQAAIADIRRLVYALRPPTLDDFGLLAALREEVGHYLPSGLQVALETPEQLPPLPAAVEVATFRIVQEALTNVARHAQASCCVVRLEVDTEAEQLDLEIRDDGRGIPAAAARHFGVGLASMRERTAELNGSCLVESLSDGGTRVGVRLPLRGLTSACAGDASVPCEAVGREA